MTITPTTTAPDPAAAAQIDAAAAAQIDAAAAALIDAAAAAAAQIDAHIEALHAMVLASLDDDQAVDVVSIPLAGKTTIADYMVIASGKSGRQVASMATKIAEKCKTEFGRSARIQGLPTADWVLIDAGDVIVHIFKPDVRQFYNLERMWAFGDEPNPGEPRIGALRVEPRNGGLG